MGDADEEVLLNLYRSPAHMKQAEAWEADLKAFEELKADCEDELRRVRGEAYQVATLYAMFQGVIVSAVSQASLLNCSLWWCPVSLSVAVSAAAFLAIADKLYSIGEVEEEINETGLNMSAIVESLDKLHQQGAALDIDKAQPKQECGKKKLAGYRFIGSTDGMSALLFLTGFTFLISYFSTSTLCRNCSPCSGAA